MMRSRHRVLPDDAPPPGQDAIVAAGLTIGILLLGIQLWLLTVALDLYLAGHGDQVWSLALVSALIFAGGLSVIWILRRRPHVAGSSAQEVHR
ncbi:MAG: hypothetical protein JOZ81_11745 [Chloroflexi bacterium]|nr:hypothetical protein [Chloroflexota bacterium]